MGFFMQYQPIPQISDTLDTIGVHLNVFNVVGNYSIFFLYDTCPGVKTVTLKEIKIILFSN